MPTNTITLSYQKHALEAFFMAGEMWLRGGQLDRPLGFSHPDQVTRLYNRNSDEFGAQETRLVIVQTEGGPQQVRVFSLRGARLLALLARTPEAKAFRRWVLDLIEHRHQRHVPAVGQLGLPGTYTLPKDTVLALEAIEPLLEADHPARQAIAELRDGIRPLPQDIGLETLMDMADAAAEEMTAATAAFRRIQDEARKSGYSLEAVKQAARRRRQMRRRGTALPLDA